MIGYPGRGSTPDGCASDTEQPAIELLDRLAGAIARAAAAGTVESLAAAATCEAAQLCAARSAALVIWDDADRPVAAALDGTRFGFPDVLDRALRGAGIRVDEVHLGGFANAEARTVLGAARLRSPGGDRGLLVLLTDAGGRPLLGAVEGAALRSFAVVVGCLADRLLSSAADRVGPRVLGQDLIMRDARSERRRIARELHDGLIQSLYGTGLAIRATATRPEIPARGRTQLLDWVERIDGLIDEARAYVDELERADDAIADLGAGLDAIAEAAALAGLDVSTEVSATEQVRPTPDVRREMLMVAREAVSNAIRHAHARRISIRADMDPADDSAELVIEDDGVGFDPAVGLPAGHGLRNMATRAAALGGTLDVYSRPHGGTKVRLRVYLSSRASGGSDDLR